MGKDKHVSGGIESLHIFMDDVDTGRTVDFNPADQGFAESLYGLVSKLSQIHDSKRKEYEAEGVEDKDGE